MPIDIESIKSKTTCPDCGNKEMALGYSYGDGSIHKKIKILGLDGYEQACTSVMIICKGCGLVVKTYATKPQKL